MESIKNFFVNLKSRLDFKFHLVTLLPVAIILLTVPAMLYLPVEYTYENRLIENMQIIILFVTFFVCIKAKTDKKFYISLALLCIILFLREINCGRTIFFPIEGVENAFWGWRDIPYGYLAEPIYGTFIAGCFLYFLITKSYKVLFRYIQKANISFYNWIFLFLGIILGTLGEKISSDHLEEMMETLFYLSFFALIYLHSQNKDYIEKQS